MNYYEYLSSKEWKEKTEEVKRIKKPFCEKCGIGEYYYKKICNRKKPCYKKNCPHQVATKFNTFLQVHHKTYDHIANEPLKDLQILCAKCHQNEHNIK